MAGSRGETGAPGSVGVLVCWTSYRNFWFDGNEDQIHPSDARLVTEIATYLRNNPTLDIGVDGSPDPRLGDTYDCNLCDRRVKAVRDALVKAGVAGDRIKTGPFGDPKSRREGRVEVLLATAD